MRFLFDFIHIVFGLRLVKDSIYRSTMGLGSLHGSIGRCISLPVQRCCLVAGTPTTVFCRAEQFAPTRQLSQTSLFTRW
jgi:hypothetical protein